MRRYAVLIFAASLTLTACAEDPSKAVPEAKVQAVEPVADKAPAQAPPTQAVQAPPSGPQSIALEGQISFIGSKVTGSNTGRFTNWIGTAKLSETGELTSMSIVVQTTDVEANFEAPTKWSKKLEAHLRDDDFFASEKHPTATFQLDQVRAAPDKATGATHTLAGRFTIRGVTKSIRFPATITQTRPFSARAEFSINRKDFGMMYDGKADNLIRDGVVMKIDLRAKG